MEIPDCVCVMALGYMGMCSVANSKQECRYILMKFAPVLFLSICPNTHAVQHFQLFWNFWNGIGIHRLGSSYLRSPRLQYDPRSQVFKRALNRVAWALAPNNFQVRLALRGSGRVNPGSTHLQGPLPC